MKTKLTVRLALVSMLLFCSVCLLAQPEENGGDPPLNDAPIDGGLSVLIAAGVGYGVKKYRDSRSAKKNNIEQGK